MVRESKSEGHGRPWTEAEDRILYAGFIMAKPFKVIGLEVGRSSAGVSQRAKRLGLIDATGQRVVDPPLFEVIEAWHRSGMAAKKGSRPRGDDL